MSTRDDHHATSLTWTTPRPFPESKRLLSESNLRPVDYQSTWTGGLNQSTISMIFPTIYEFHPRPFYFIWIYSTVCPCLRSPRRWTFPGLLPELLCYLSVHYSPVNRLAIVPSITGPIAADFAVSPRQLSAHWISPRQLCVWTSYGL